MKRWQIVVVAVVLILGTAFFFLFMYQGSSKPIEAVADQFKPAKNWQLVDDQVVPPTFMCFEANCPSVHRSWRTGGNLTKQEFQVILDASNWRFNIQGDCLPHANISGSGETLCDAQGHVNGYDIDVTAIGSFGDSTNGRVTLSVNKPS